MIKTDHHTHTHYSFDILDTGYSPEDMITAAKEKGLDTIVLTDHLEVNSEIEGLYAPFDFQARAGACAEAKANASGITVAVGIELGQPEQYPKEAEKYLKENDFEFVLGSLHNIKDMPDFCLIDYSNYSPDDFMELWKKYLDEYSQLVDFEGIDSFSHLTYPLRYYARRRNYHLDTRKTEDELSKILSKIISKGKYMEVNASGYRQGLEGPLPNEHIISLYAALGGKYVTVGSDAHLTKDIALDFDRTEALIKKYDLKIKEWGKQ